MNIAFIDYSLATNSLDIYVSGCNGNCVGCHNPELFDFNIGEKYSKELFEEKIKNRVELFGSMINKIMIFGGEPLDQDKSELQKMLNDLNGLCVDIWLFTRYNIKNIPEDIMKICDYIKTGRYNENLNGENIQHGIPLASTNQKIYKINH